MSRHTHTETTAGQSINLPRALHKKLAMHAAMHKETVRDYILEAIQEKMVREHKPNKVTEETFRKTDAGLELTEYKSAEDLFKKLGI